MVISNSSVEDFLVLGYEWEHGSGSVDERNWNAWFHNWRGDVDFVPTILLTPSRCLTWSKM